MIDSHSESSFSPNNKRPFPHTSASIHLKPFDLPLFPSTPNAVVSPCHSIRLHADRPYTIGRSPRHCDFLFLDRRVSNQHCQILLDSSLRKLYILNGVLIFPNDSAKRVVHAFRKRVTTTFRRGTLGDDFILREASNGVFVNGIEIEKGMAAEFSVGDKVSLVCVNEDGSCGIQNRIGFVVQRIEFDIDDVEIDGLTLPGHSQGKRKNRVFAVSRYDGIIGRANFLLDRCRDILLSDDPLSCVFRVVSDIETGRLLSVDSEVQSKLPPRVKNSSMQDTTNGVVQSSSDILCESKAMALKVKHDLHRDFCREGNVGVACGNDIADKNHSVMLLNSIGKDDLPFGGHNKQAKQQGGIFYPSPGKNFYLNHLEFMDHGSPGFHHSISLHELLYPVEGISRMFIATFTSDIKWFLTYCNIPFHLPVTIACHNSERCWSSRLDDRVFVPYQDYPNLVVVYPQFPESIAFSNNHKKHGIACHHPKLIVLQREDSIRVVITSANLVEKQWNSVTNTIWWQDFPHVISADFASLFPKTDGGEIPKDPKCDFAAQLAGFMASLIVDVPSQAHWITHLTKYDFGGAKGHLVASVPGIHFNSTVMSECLEASLFLGSVVASVVGFSHLFRTAADSNSARLKALAAFLGKSCKNAYGRLEIVLRRNLNVPADENAVSVLVPNPDGTSEGDYVQLGFLPRNVAKWVSPLWDA